MAIVVFEDQQCELLAPVSLARPAAAIRCASFRLVDFLDLLFEEVYSIVRPHLTAIQRADYPSLRSLGSDGTDGSLGADQESNEDRPIGLMLNARIAPTSANLQSIEALLSKAEKLAPTQPYVVMHGEQVAAVVYPKWSLHYLFGAGYLGTEDWLNKAKQLPTIDVPLQLFHYPHDVISLNASCFSSNLALRDRLQSSEVDSYSHFEAIAPRVFVAPGVSVGDFVSLDASAGPIYLERGVKISPFSRLAGPIYIGENSEIREHSFLRGGVSIGRHCRIGGEVNASVIESFTDKEHTGYLGHSYVGSWVHLGAGTNVSDLKNNFGTVFMDYDEVRVSTGTPRMGCILGDFSKAAVNTAVLTGKRIGVGSTLYGFVTTDVPSFTNYAQSFGQCSEITADQAVGIGERMANLRNAPLRSCELQLLQDLHRLTQIERDCAKDMISD